MNKKEEEIQRKLAELETTVLKEQTDLTISTGQANANLTHAGKAESAASSGSDSVTKNDGAYFGGLALIFAGLVMVFQHVRVGSGLFAMLGMGSGGFALLFLPLMVGIGMMFYDSKNKWGWIVTALSCVFLILATLATLTMTFSSVTMLQLIVMFVPFALGAALLVKGLGGAKGVEQAVKKQLTKKEG